MKLADYLAQAEIKHSVFAERIGVTRQTLWRYVSGERRPEWDVLERIRTETAGQVTPNDFLDDEGGAAPADPPPPKPLDPEAASLSLKEPEAA